MNFYSYRPTGSAVPRAEEFALTEISAEVIEERKDEMETLGQRIKQKIVYGTNPAQKFQTLIDDGTFNQVADARMKGEELSLMQLLKPKSKKNSEQEDPKEQKSEALVEEAGELQMTQTKSKLAVQEFVPRPDQMMRRKSTYASLID